MVICANRDIIYKKFCNFSLLSDSNISDFPMSYEMRQSMLKYHKYLIYVYGFLAVLAFVLGFVNCPELPKDFHIFHDLSGNADTVFIVVFLLLIVNFCVRLVRDSSRYASSYRSLAAPAIYSILISIFFWYNLKMFSHTNDFLSTIITDVTAVKLYYFPKFLFIVFCALVIWHYICYMRIKNSPEQNDNAKSNIKTGYW